MDIMTILLCTLIESILYFWFIFLTIDMFEVNDQKLLNDESTRAVDAKNRFYDVSPFGVCVFVFLRCQQIIEL